jgi:hypothetical protein
MNEMNIGVTLSKPQVNPPKAQASYTLLAGSTCGKCYLNQDGDVILPDTGGTFIRFRLMQADLQIEGVAHKLSLEAGAFAIKSGPSNQFPSSVLETPPLDNPSIKVEAKNSDGREYAYALKVVAHPPQGGAAITLDLDPKIKNGGTTLLDHACQINRDDLIGLALVLTSALALVALAGCIYFVRKSL